MKGWKKIFQENRDQKKTGVAILISNKIDFKTKAGEKRQRRPLHNDQRINPRRRYNNYKHIYIQHRSTTICKAAAVAKSFQSYLTLCDPLHGSPPGSSVPGILQARVLEWGAIAFSEYVRQMLTGMKGDINRNIIIVVAFNTPTHTYG